MEKKTFAMKMLAMVLALVICLGNLGPAVQAADASKAEPEMVQNFEDTYYKQDGTKGSESDWEVHLSKTATPTAVENVYDITLKIQTKDTSMTIAGATHGAATLVLDLSNSMEGNRLISLKAAVADFLNTFAKGAESGDKRMVSIVVFGTDAVRIQNWVDVTNAAALADAKAKVNSLSTGNGVYLGWQYQCNGGTNLEAGLVLGRNLLKDSAALKDIPTENQSLIVFSDGDPTAAVGNVSDPATDKISYDKKDTGTKTDMKDYDDVQKILASVAAAKIGVKYGNEHGVNVMSKTYGFDKVYASKNAKELSVALQTAASEVITTTTVVDGIVDPMGRGVTMLNVPANYKNGKWDLSELTPVVENGITTYTITYQVELDPKQVPADVMYPGYTVLTPANGRTYLKYSVNGCKKEADFNEPNIRGILPKYNYEVIYNANFGADPEISGDSENAYGINDVRYSIGVDEVMFENEGYTFQGWATTPDGSVVYKAGAKISFEEGGSETLYAIWDENPKYDYELVYDANFGDKPETVIDEDSTYGTYATSHSASVDANMFDRENYTFLYWAENPNGEGEHYQESDTVAFTEPGRKTLYAIWQENAKYDYALVYNANFGENNTEPDDENVTGVYDAEYSMEVDELMFQRNGYTFLYWAENPNGEGEHYQESDTIAFTEPGRKTLYAIWEKIPTYDYSLIYNANFDDNDIQPDDENVTGIYDTTYSMEVDELMFQRDNYTFLGWATEISGEPEYQAGEVILFTEPGSKTLYAIWEESAKYDYEVIYNANFGENETKADSENILDTYDTTRDIIVDTNTFVRENYTFVGWAEEADGAVVYTAGDVISFTEGGSKTLYAIWTDVLYTYTVEYYVRVDDGEYVLFTGDAEDLHVGGSAIFGAVIDEEIVEAPAELNDGEFTYTFDSLEGIVVGTEENVVKVYYQTETVEILDDDVPLEDIPEEDVPLSDNPKTGDIVMLPTALAVVSASGLTLMLKLKKKEENEDEEV